MMRRRYLRERLSDGLAFVIVFVFVLVPVGIVDAAEAVLHKLKRMLQR